MQQQRDFIRRRLRNMRNDLFGLKVTNAELNKELTKSKALNVKLNLSLLKEKQKNKLITCALQQEKRKHKHLQDHTAALLYAGDDFCTSYDDPPRTPPPSVSETVVRYVTPAQKKKFNQLPTEPPNSGEKLSTPKKRVRLILVFVVIFLWSATDCLLYVECRGLIPRSAKNQP